MRALCGVECIGLSAFHFYSGSASGLDSRISSERSGRGWTLADGAPLRSRQKHTSRLAYRITHTSYSMHRYASTSLATMRLVTFLCLFYINLVCFPEVCGCVSHCPPP